MANNPIYPNNIIKAIGGQIHKSINQKMINICYFTQLIDMVVATT